MVQLGSIGNILHPFHHLLQTEVGSSQIQILHDCTFCDNFKLLTPTSYICTQIYKYLYFRLFKVCHLFSIKVVP